MQRLVLAAVTVLAVVVSGCSSTKPAPTNQDPGAPIEIWIRQAPDSESHKTLIKLANAFTEKTKIQTKVVAIFDGFETKLQQQGAQRALPDIVINDTAQLGNMQQQGWLREVKKSDLPGSDKIQDRAWNAAKASDGKFYAMPFSAQSFLLLVRSDWRKKVGLAEPKSWEELAALGKAFTTGDPDGNGKADTYGFVVPGGTERGYMSWYASSYIWGNGGNFVEEAGTSKWKPAINNTKSVEAVSWLRDQFCTNKSVNPGAVTNNTTVSHEVFEKGQAGIYLVGPYVLARFVKSMGSDKIEALALPKGPSGGPGTLAEGENVYLMDGSKNQAGQLKFAEFAASVEGQKIGMNKDDPGAIVRLPVNKDVDMSTVRQDPRWKVFQDFYNAAGVYTPSVPNWAPFRQTSADGINAIMANCGSDVRQSLDKLADQLGAELKKQNVLAA
ncbi:MAG TPA: sugar-binding protein [Micromonosporaceae bacterium]|nr:sugar-binding protein [Micromonosporaceae bacterium]